MKKFLTTFAILCIAGAICLMTFHKYEVRRNPETVSLYNTLIQVDHEFCAQNWAEARHHLAELPDTESVRYALNVVNNGGHGFVGLGSPVIWDELTDQNIFWYDGSWLLMSISLVGIAIASLVAKKKS